LSGLASLATDPRPIPKQAASAPPRLVFSAEQEQFLTDNHSRLLLSALAGSGKTACLFEYARRRPHQRWHFLVLNRDLADTLAALAPRNVTVSTLHKMAYAIHGHALSSKLTSRPVPSLALGRALSGHLPAPPAGLLEALAQGLELFCVSADPTPGVEHAPRVWQADPAWDPDVWTRSLRALWSASLDPNDPLPISHDVYLKRFCQQELPWRGTYWMLDEAQDWPDAVLSAFRRCTQVSVRAGDPCQRLYAFRGASLGLWHDPALEREHRLVQSHRASAQLAPWVNAALSRLPGGWQWAGRQDMKCEIHRRSEAATGNDLLAFAPTALLADRWKTLEQALPHLEGFTLGWPAAAPRGASQEADVQVWLSTIHAAKGREFSRVWLPDDVLSPGLSPALSARLAYVALTRTRNAISFPSSLVALGSALPSLEETPLDFFQGV
jgi:hypothetical protein